MINPTVRAIYISAFVVYNIGHKSGYLCKEGHVRKLNYYRVFVWSNNLCDFVKGDSLDDLVYLRRWSKCGTYSLYNVNFTKIDQNRKSCCFFLKCNEF